MRSSSGGGQKAGVRAARRGTASSAATVVEGKLAKSMAKLRINSNTPGRSKPSSAKRGLTTGSGRPCRTLDDIHDYISSGQISSVIVMAGAGISVPCGIPDFRTPGSGLYDNLQRYKIPYPEAIFDIEYFEVNPKPFFTLAKELYPTGKYRPSLAHHFVRLLHEKGLLLRMYTQNIDGLERIAGIPAEKLVEAHGTFAAATCQICSHKTTGEAIKDAIFSDKLPRCKKNGCLGVVKPDITFFGEDLPRRFYYYLRDFPQADLLIVMGTSLEVMPFASIVDSCRMHVPRLLLNKVLVGPFRSRKRSSDVTMQGDISEMIDKFVTKLGWHEDMETLMTQTEGRELKLSSFLTPKPAVASTSAQKTPSTTSSPSEAGGAGTSTAARAKASPGTQPSKSSGGAGSGPPPRYSPHRPLHRAPARRPPIKLPVAVHGASGAPVPVRRVAPEALFTGLNRPRLPGSNIETSYKSRANREAERGRYRFSHAADLGNSKQSLESYRQFESKRGNWNRLLKDDDDEDETDSSSEDSSDSDS